MTWSIWEQNPLETASQPAKSSTPPERLPSRPSFPSSGLSTAPSFQFPAGNGQTDYIYRILAEKTDPSQIEALQKLNEFLAPLKQIPGLTDAQRYQAAIAQAKAHSKWDKSDLTKGWDRLSEILEEERRNFQDQSAERTREYVTEKTGAVVDMAQQITSLTQQKAVLEAEINRHTVSIQQSNTSFDQAYQRRKQEIGQQEAELDKVIS